jgi:hypothetical protein
MAAGVPHASRFGWAMLLTVAACSGGQVVTIGFNAPQPYRFDTPRVVSELAAPADRTDNPTLTGDVLEIFFTSDRGGTGDLWFAKRANAASPFGAPEPIDALNTGGFETSAAISSDGLTLWFGSDRPGGVGLIDIWASTRASRTSAWMAPVNVLALNSAADDIPRPPGLRGTVMPMASTRAVTNLYRTYFASRAGRGAPFGEPGAISLQFPDRSTVDAFLSDDGLTMFYSSAGVPTSDGGAGSTSDLFVAFRRSTGDPFENSQRLDDLDTSADERDPWLTPDGKTLYFTSDRDGPLVIYTAAVRPRE